MTSLDNRVIIARCLERESIQWSRAIRPKLHKRVSVLVLLYVLLGQCHAANDSVSGSDYDILARNSATTATLAACAYIRMSWHLTAGGCTL